MKRTHRKAIAALLLGGYFLAVTVGGAFHTHLGWSCGDEDGASGGCHTHMCDAGHGHEQPVGSAPSDEPTVEMAVVPLDAHCPICSFMSQKPIPVATCASEVSAELRQPLVRVRAISPSKDIPATIFSRGPPIA